MKKPPVTYMFGREVGETLETINSYRLAHVSWGPDANDTNKAELIDKMFESFVERITSPPEKLMLKSIVYSREKIREAIKLTQVDISTMDWSAETSEDRSKLNKIFGYLEQASMVLGNHVRNL